MQMAKSRIQFACPKCNQAFAGKGNDLSRNRANKNFPLIINCGHSICKGCAESTAKENKHIICSICQAKTELENGDASVNSLLSDLHVLGRLAAKDVGLNFHLLRSTEKSESLSKSKGSSNVICDECSHKEAVWRCDKCVANFCNVCFDAVHKASRLLKKHEGKPIFVESYRTKVQEGCPDHEQRPIEFYCEVDEELVCSYCFSSVGKHVGHLVVPLADKNRACLDKLKMGIEEGLKVQNRLQKAEKRLTKALPDSNFGTCHQYGKILDEFHRLHSFLQLREAELAAELDSILNRDTEMLGEMRQRVSDHNKELSSLIKDAQQALNNSFISMNVCDVLKKLDAAKDLPCYLVMTNEEGGEVRMNFDSNLVDVVKNHGKIEADLKLKYTLKNEEELPPDYEEPEDDMTTDSESVTSFGESSLEDIQTSNGVQLTCLPSQQLSFCSTLKQEKVYVTHIHHPSQFWVQRSSDARKLKALTDSINKWCFDPRNLKYVPSSLTIGQLYLVQFEADSSWYRARVKKILNSSIPFEEVIKTVDSDPEAIKAEVFYIDFGNTEIVPITRFREMQPKFIHLEGFAMECCLWDILPSSDEKEWSEVAVKMFATFVANRELLMAVVDTQGSVLYVDLSQPGEDGRGIKNDTPVSVRDALVFMEVGCFVSVNSPEMLKMKVPFNKTKMRQFYPPEPLPTGKVLNALLSHSINPHHFYLQQMGGNARYLANLIFNMQKQYNLSTPNDIHTIYAPKKGMICVSQYSLDKQWYRAKVIGLPGGAKVEVLYVDFGNTEIVSCKNLRKIMDDFVKLPCQAIKCSLSGVTPMEDKEWSAESNEWFTDAAGKKELSLIVNKITPGDGIAEVSLYHSKGRSMMACINGTMVKEGFAKTTGQESTIIEVPTSVLNKSKEIYSRSPTAILEKKKKPIIKLPQPDSAIKVQQEAKRKGYFAVTVSHIDSPYSIYLHCIEQKDQLEKMMAEMQKVYSQSQCSEMNITPGQTYAVVHPINKRWYRGHVMKVLDNEFVQVQFVDYGLVESVSVDQVQPLLQPFVDAIIFSVKCQLDGIIPAGGSTWSHIACETLKTLVSSVDVLYLQRTDKPPDAYTLAVELFIKEIVSSALEVTSVKYKSVSEMLIEKGVALPKDRLKRRSSSESGKNVTKSFSQEVIHEEKASSDSTSLQLSSLPTPEPVVQIPVTARNHYISLSDWIASENPKKTSFISIPSHVGTDGCIYFHIEGQGSLELIKNALQLKYSTPNSQPPVSYPSPGQACIARFCVDELWYRAVVTKVEPPDIEVMFVDYGNVEIIPLKDIRTEIILEEIRCQAYECLLYGIETISENGVWPTGILDFIHHTIVEQKCTMNVVKQSPPEERLIVKLELPGGLDLADVLVLMKEAKRISLQPMKTTDESVVTHNSEGNVQKEITEEQKEVENATMNNPFTAATLPNLGILFPVIVTQALDYNIVFIQRHQIDDPKTEWENLINEEIEKFLSLMAELSEKADQFAEVQSIEIGKVYCGMYTYDSSWYRCLVTETKDDAAVVSYVDYGNSETIPIERLRQLPTEYMELPHQAVMCKIRGIEPVGDNWADEIASNMATAFFPKEGRLIAKVCNLGCPNEIDLMLQISEDKPKLAYQHLIDNGLIKLNETSEE